MRPGSIIPALQDGARLQALEANQIFKALLKWHTKKVEPILHQEKLEEAKNEIEEATNLRPTNEKLLKGYKSLKIPPRIKDHMRNMLTGKIKCGPYWNKIPSFTDRAICSACRKANDIEVIESEYHLWLECENNGQSLTWNTAKSIWQKSTDRVRGTAAMKFEIDPCKDSDSYES